MINILSIADRKSDYLENILIRKPEIRTEINYFFSCGDLSPRYISYMASLSNKLIYYINGNHHIYDKNYKDYFKQKTKIQYLGENIPGGIDLHGKVIEDENFILCGFGGVKWYKKGDYQFYEPEMQRITNKVKRKIKFIRFKNRILNKNPKKIIVISHTPPQGINDVAKDNVHQGFACFKRFIEEIQPLLWLHGHIHLQSFNQVVSTTYHNTQIVNSYEYKRVEITGDKIKVYYNFN